MHCFYLPVVINTSYPEGVCIPMSSCKSWVPDMPMKELLLIKQCLIKDSINPTTTFV